MKLLRFLQKGTVLFFLKMQKGTVLFFLKIGPSPFCKCKGDTRPCPCLVGSAPKDDTVENRQGQGIMSPKVIYGQSPQGRPQGTGWIELAN